ncbi:hypothetical protein EDC01DRAFT_727048 [Geopyxis carbonaria]|nr:hypothetical protein EDC01DRAFT_727048 [Geopyxis carbonaria]
MPPRTPVQEQTGEQSQQPAANKGKEKSQQLPVVINPRIRKIDTRPLPSIADRVNHMVDIRAYTIAGTGHKSRKDLKHFVTKKEKLFRKLTADMETYQVRTLAKTLKEVSTSSQSDAYKAMESQASNLPDSVKTFTRIYSNGKPIRIEDLNDFTLVHRQPASIEALKAIEDADGLMEKNTQPLAAGKRANVDSAHLGIWGDYDIGLYRTKETENLWFKGGEQWEKAAQPALKEIAFFGKHLNPEAAAMVGKMDLTENVQRKLGGLNEKKLKPIAEMFFAVALNRGQADEGTMHQDWADTQHMFNAAIAYGKDYQSGWLVIWQLKVLIEMRRGDILYFYGSYLAHNVIEIVGERNSLDCFTHRSVLDWWKRINVDSHTNDYHKPRKQRDEDETETAYKLRHADSEVVKPVNKLKRKEVKEKGLLNLGETTAIFGHLMKKQKSMQMQEQAERQERMKRQTAKEEAKKQAGEQAEVIDLC